MPIDPTCRTCGCTYPYHGDDELDPVSNGSREAGHSRPTPTRQTRYLAWLNQVIQEPSESIKHRILYNIMRKSLTTSNSS